MRPTPAAMLVAAAAVLALAAWPAVALGQAAGARAPLEELAARLSARYHARVLLDPEIPVTTVPTEPDPALPLTAAMDALTARTRGIAWRYVRLQGGIGDVGHLAAAVRAVEGIAPTGFAVEDAGKHAAYLAIRDRDRADRSGLAYEPGPASDRVVLLFSSIAPADGLTRVERFARLEALQADLMRQVGAESRANPMLQTAQLMQALDRNAASAFMQRTMAAGSAAWDSTPADQRQQMVGAAMRVIQTYGAPSAGRPRAELPRDYWPELNAIAKSAGSQHGAIVLVDPALRVETPPSAPARTDSLEQTLDSLTASQRGAVWRRVYVSRQEPASALTAESLARSARAMDAVKVAGVVAEKAEPSRFAALWRSSTAVRALREDLRAAGLSATPMYLVYSPDTVLPRGVTPTELYDRLQREQFGAMLGMSPEELTLAMQATIARFGSGAADASGDLMGLPIMATMMAVWMPKAAQEGKGQP